MTDRLIVGVVCTHRPTIQHGRGKPHLLKLDPMGCRPSDDIPLLFEHRQRARVGSVLALFPEVTKVTAFARVDDTELGNEAWEMIESGAVSAFSVRASHKPYPMEGLVAVVSRWRLEDLSITQSPRNPDCRFDILPADQAADFMAQWHVFARASA